MYISKKNKKMDIPTWSLPSGKTCPGSTSFCRKKCYARKTEYIWPCVLPCRKRNLVASKRETFEIEMLPLIAKCTKKVPYFRIHESGDFYDQEYLEKWFQIVRAFPRVRFLAFTKSFHLNFEDKPENLQIVWSIMPDTVCVPRKRNNFPHAYAGECFYHGRSTFECPGHCNECLFCWYMQADQSVHFKIH